MTYGKVQKKCGASMGKRVQHRNVLPLLPVNAGVSKSSGEPMILSFPREIGLRRTPCNNKDDYDSYISKVNGKASCYTSLYAFEKCDDRMSWKMDIESVVMDRAWWDFDTTEDTTLEDVRADVLTLLSRLEGDVRTVFTGRGFHVHQFFDTPVKGTAIARHIDRYQRHAARGLKTLDGVGFPQKLTRIPDTYNPKRGRWAVNIDTVAFKADPNYDIPTHPSKELQHHDPFTGDAPTNGFNIRKWIADNPVTEIRPEGVLQADIGHAGQIPIPPCIEKAIEGDNPKHTARLALGYHLVENLRWFADPKSLTSEQRESIIQEAINFIEKLNWRDFNRSMTRSQIESIVDHEFSPSCSWLQTRIGCPAICWRDDGTRRN